MTDHHDLQPQPTGLDEDSTDRRPSRLPLTGRRLAAAAVALVLIAAAVLTITRLGPDDTAADPTGEPWNTDAVTVGDLALSDRLEGTLERASELVVVHRISGVTPGTNGSNTSGLTTGVIATGTATGGIGSGGLSATFRPALVATGQCDATPDPDNSPTSTDPPTTTTADASTTTTTDTSSSSATDTAAPDPTTTEPEPTTTTEAEPTTAPQPCDPGTTSTTAPNDSIPAPPGAPTGGGAPTGNGFPSGGGTLGGGGLGGTGGAGGGSSNQTASIPTEMVTSVTTSGSVVHSGDILYSVDGRPVVALTGTAPAWRDLDSTVDAGADVAQLETALVALGYDGGGDLTVDDEWDSHTTAAVKAWQTGLGLEDTGELPLGYIVFVPTDTVVTAVSAAVGQALADGDAVLELGTPSQQVVATVPTELQAVITPGLDVDVSGVSATVTRLGSSTGADGAVLVVAYITPNDQIEAANGTSVSARFTVTDAANVLLVPVDAVTSRTDGSYAVLAVDDTGKSGTWLPIEVHGVANGNVAATGDGLHDGLTVGIPGDATAATP